MLVETQADNPITIFISYSHRDEEFQKELYEHLGLLRRNNEIEAWYDRKIVAGDDLKNVIDEHLSNAHIILLLVSASFLNSDYCYTKEMKRALERHDNGEARVIPIILRTCDWFSSDFGKLLALPTDGKPINTWQDQDQAFYNVVLGLRVAINNIKEKQKSQKAPNDLILIPPFKTNNKDGGEMIWIPEGNFWRGSNDRDNEKPYSEIWLDGYYIYKNPVTVKQYMQFCNETNYNKPSEPNWGWNAIKTGHIDQNISGQGSNLISVCAQIGCIFCQG